MRRRGWVAVVGLPLLPSTVTAQADRRDDRAQFIAQQWNAPPQDSAALAALAINSARFRDARVHAAIVAAAKDIAAPRQMRLAAIRALVGHFDQCRFVEFEEGPSPDGGTRYWVWMGSYDGVPPTTQGKMPLPGAVREDVLSTLRHIGEADPDPAVRDVAGRLARSLAQLKDVRACGGL